jgi:hypothetical protein
MRKKQQQRRENQYKTTRAFFLFSFSDEEKFGAPSIFFLAATAAFKFLKDKCRREKKRKGIGPGGAVRCRC